MATLLLLLAIVLEVFGTVLLRMSDGFSRLVPTVAFALAYGLSFYCIAQVMRTLTLGYVYAMWSGIGTVGAAVIATTYFHEQVSPGLVVGIALIVAGVVVLNLAGPIHR